MTNAMKPQAPKKMSVQEIENLQSQTKEYEEVLNNVDGLSTGLQNSASIKRLVNRNKMLLARDEELIAKGRQKDAIVKRIKEIEAIVAPFRPSRIMMEAKPGTSDFDKAVKMGVELSKKYSHLMTELKSLKRRLEPGDPSAGNLERIRRD